MRTEGWLRGYEIEGNWAEVSTFGSPEVAQVPTGAIAHVNIDVPVTSENAELFTQLCDCPKIGIYFGTVQEIVIEVNNKLSEALNPLVPKSKKHRLLRRWIRPAKEGE